MSKAFESERRAGVEFPTFRGFLIHITSTIFHCPLSFSLPTTATSHPRETRKNRTDEFLHRSIGSCESENLSKSCLYISVPLFLILVCTHAC